MFIKFAWCVVLLFIVEENILSVTLHVTKWSLCWGSAKKVITIYSKYLQTNKLILNKTKIFFFFLLCWQCSLCTFLVAPNDQCYIIISFHCCQLHAIMNLFEFHQKFKLNLFEQDFFNRLFSLFFSIFMIIFFFLLNTWSILLYITSAFLFLVNSVYNFYFCW